MEKNNLIASIGAFVLVILFLGFLWLIGHYPLVVIGGCVAFLLWGLFLMLKEQIKDVLDSKNGEIK